MMPVWVYLLATLFQGLLSGVAVFAINKKVSDYKQALYVREKILAADNESYAQIAPGGTLVITTEEAPRRIRIHSRHWAQLRVSFE